MLPKLYSEGGKYKLYPFMISKRWAKANPEELKRLDSKQDLYKKDPAWYVPPDEFSTSEDDSEPESEGEEQADSGVEGKERESEG